MDFNDRFGQPNSVYPCTKALTFGPWIYMVPPYKPKDELKQQNPPQTILTWNDIKGSQVRIDNIGGIKTTFVAN